MAKVKQFNVRTMLPLVLLITTAATPCVTAAEGVHVNGAFIFDEMGQQVHAHGGGLIKVGDWYYFFGDNRHLTSYTFFAVSCYRSRDLVNWEFRNHVLTWQSDPELALANIERPKVVYNASTGKYVLWAHKENGLDYNEARAAVAWCDTVDGDYTWVGSFRPMGYMSRDCTLFVDDDGAGYFLSTANNNADLHLYRLTADYLAPAQLVKKIWQGQAREAPCLFKRNGYYFIVSSGCTGWQPNQGKYGYATNLAGPWSSLHDLGSGATYQSQSTYVLPLSGTQGTSYLYIGDRWAPDWGGAVNDSRYIMLPLEFSGTTTMTMPWCETVSIDVTAGTIAQGPTCEWTKVDDDHANASYSSNWGIWINNPGYLRTVHYSETTGKEVTFAFTGTAARWYGFLRNDLGYADIYVDGGFAAQVDCYGTGEIGDILLYETAELPEGPHTLTIRVTGQKNPASSGTELLVDAFAWKQDIGEPAVPVFDPAANYRITCFNSGKVLTVGTANTSQVEAAILQYTDAGANWQRWLPVGLGGGAFRIENLASGLCLDVAGAAMPNEAAVVQRAWTASATQKWRMITQPDGLWQIVSAADGRVLDISGGSIADGAELLVYQDHGGLNQKWLVEATRPDRWQATYAEAESAAGQPDFAPWHVVTGGTTPASESIEVPSGEGTQTTVTQGIAQYTVTLDKRSRVKAWMLAESTDEGTNSVYVRWDDETWQPLELPVDGAWTWAYGGTRTLAAGPHTLSLAWREAATGLDTVRFAVRAQPRADLTDDGEVSLPDLGIMADQWLTAGPTADLAPESGDGTVNWLDYEVLLSEWKR